MFIYDKKIPIDIAISRPNPKTYLLLDTKLHGTKRGLDQAMVYVRQSFMIHNEEFHDIFMRLGAKQISDMEVLARLIHLFHGVDDRYYDESNDDTPAFEYILPSVDHTTKKSCCCQEPKEEKHHVNNDLTAAVMRNIKFEEAQMLLYQSLGNEIDDQEASKVFQYLENSTKKSLTVLHNLLEILTTHTELKDWGMGGTHDEADLDTSNPIDKPNPIFINPNDI